MKIQLDMLPMSQWFQGLPHPLFMAGPCSAESEEQMMEVAHGIAASGKVTVLRAGIWKPRTRPDTFEGRGEQALPWLKAAAKQNGLLSLTEVANAAHVEAALKAEIDMLWVGARTTVNPFSVQEIADALQGVDIPVLVKNPIHPELQLWIGALERINKAGIKKLAAIHRGFSTYEKTPFRNAPMWEIPIELKRLIPQLPIICDPSHISGTRELIEMVSQKALDLDMAGLIIETHPDPEHALSDAQQQITPARLNELLSGLSIRNPEVSNHEFQTALEELRTKIDDLDLEILQKFAARMDIAEKIGEYKKENQVTILQLQRWEEIIRKRKMQGEAMGLSDAFLRKLLEIIHEESIRRQNGVMNNSSK